MREAVFLVFGCVSAQFGFPSPANQVPRLDVRCALSSQVCFNLRLCQSLAKNQKSSFRSATSFLSML
jgi:hypothetical protein